MDYLSSFCIVLGTLVVVTRAPLVFSPLGTLNAFRRLFDTLFKVRAAGVIFMGFGAAVAWLPLGTGLLPLLAWLYGWVVVFVGVASLLFPGHAQRVLLAAYDFAEGALTGAGLRVLGALGVAVGAGLVYLGLYVV